MIETTLHPRQATEPGMKARAGDPSPASRIRYRFAVAFIIVTTLVVFIPLNPEMPDKGITQEWLSAMKQFHSQTERSLWREGARLDPSWIFALNAAAARHLKFGKQIIFTGGPYAAIYTRSFHPSTDRLMIFGSLLLGLSYAMALLYLGLDRKLSIVLAFMLFLNAFPQRDALLLSYPLLLVVCALKFANAKTPSQRPTIPSWMVFTMGAMLSGLGLLPLIKGSLLLPAILGMVLVGAILFSSVPRRQALPLFVVAPLASVVFWIVSGQSLFDFPDFIRNTMWLTSGYTDAMSLTWISSPRFMGIAFVIIYLIMLALIWVSLFRCALLSSRSRWMLGFVSTVFLLVAFKHGFVRSDDYHLLIAVVSLAIALFILSLFYVDRYIIGSLVALLIIIVGFSLCKDPTLRMGSIWKRAPGILARITCESTVQSYVDGWEGLRSRLSDSGSLRKRFEVAMSNIQEEYTVPVTEGSVDIYSYEQAIPIASSLSWDPRPIFQSYSVYTPELAQTNEQHVRGASAPEWVLIDLHAIDGRLPLLEDGLSWPALLDNYAFHSFDGQFILMHRNDAIRGKSNMEVVFQNRQTLGAMVSMRESEGPLFAEVDLEPTLLGRLLTTLLNPPQLNMLVKLRDGSSGKYRVIANMMKTGFIVSPLVRNTEEFALLAKGDKRFEEDAKVASISIEPSYGGSVFWARTYTLTLKKYHSAQGSSESGVVNKDH